MHADGGESRGGPPGAGRGSPGEDELRANPAGLGANTTTYHLRSR